MIAVVVSAEDDRTKCSGCGQWMVAGDVVVAIEQGRDVYVHRTLWFHREHFDDLLAATPPAGRQLVVDTRVAAIAAFVADTGTTPVEAILAAA